MRTLGEILDMVHSGKKPEYEELLLALDAMSALAVFDRKSFQELAKAEAEKRRPILTSSAAWQNKERLNRWQRALDKTPDLWLGWDNDPRNHECIARRGRALRMFEKIAEDAKNKAGKQVEND